MMTTATAPRLHASAILYSVAALGAGLLTACASLPIPDELKQAGEQLDNPEFVRTLAELAPKLLGASKEERERAVKACAANDKASCSHHSTLAKLYLDTAIEKSRKASAEKRLKAAEERKSAADKTLEEEQVRKTTQDGRLARLNRIQELEKKLAGPLSEEQANETRAQLEKEKRAARMAMKEPGQPIEVGRTTSLQDSAKKGNTDILVERQAMFEEALAILGRENTKQTYRGLVLTARGLFASGKTEILSDKVAMVTSLGGLASKYPRYAVLVEGHTDDRGSAKLNLSLSKRRAESVVKALRKTVDSARLRAKGIGEDKPISDNSSPTGRGMNRRVEIVFLFED